MMSQGNFWRSAWRGLMVFVVFGVTFVFMGHPEWKDITIGSIGFALVHWAAAQYKV